MSLINKVDQFNDDVDIAHQIVHGDSATTVATEGGPVRSLAKLIADKDAEFVGGDVVQQAMAARDASESARDVAVLARDAAMVGAVTYPDEATGRAAVADGEYFKVIGSGDVAAREYRRTNASTSVLVAEYPSSQALKDILLNYGFDKFSLPVYINKLNGKLISDASYLSTDYLPILGGEEYAVISYTFGNAECVWFDINKNIISTFPATHNIEVSVVAPENAAYVRLTSLAEQISIDTGMRSTSGVLSIERLVATFKNADLQISDTSIVTQDGNLVDTLSRIDSEFDIVNNVAQQSFSSNVFTEGGFITATGNQYWQGEADYACTDFLLIQENVQYDIRTATPGNSRCAWYDKDKKIISAFVANDNKSYIVISPKNAFYLRASCLRSKLNSDVRISSLDGRYALDRLTGALSKLSLSVGSLNVKQKVVTTESERNAISDRGLLNRAWPPGLRVYDEGLRSDVVADGIWWRLPDGTPADVVDRTEVFPGFDEARKNLPTYASSHSVVADVADITKWAASAGANCQTAYIDNLPAVEMMFTSTASPDVTYQSGAPLSVNRFLIFNLLYDAGRNSGITISLVNSSGTDLFEKKLATTDMGKNPRSFLETNDFRRFEVDTQNLQPLVEGASFDDVTGVRFRVTRTSGYSCRFFVGKVESVSFKARITLRFDDARASIYQNAFQKMQDYGFKGITAVHTNAVGGIGFCTLGQLQEMNEAGWDLVSHFTHQPSGGMNSLTYEELNAGFRDSKQALKEMGASLLARSVYIAPQGQYLELSAKTAYKYYDAQINQVYLNRLMPRRPEGSTFQNGTWTSMGAFVGDGKTAEQLISGAQAAIDGQGWQIVMLHDILPDNSDAYTVTTQDFNEFVGWLDANRDKIEVVTVTQMVNQMRGVV